MTEKERVEAFKKAILSAMQQYRIGIDTITHGGETALIRLTTKETAKAAADYVAWLDFEPERHPQPRESSEQRMARHARESKEIAASMQLIGELPDDPTRIYLVQQLAVERVPGPVHTWQHAGTLAATSDAEAIARFKEAALSFMHCRVRLLDESLNVLKEISRA